MKLFAMFEVGDDGDTSSPALLERVADEIMTYVDPITEGGVSLPISNVQVGAMMDVPTFVDTIKAELAARETEPKTEPKKLKVVLMTGISSSAIFDTTTAHQERGGGMHSYLGGPDFSSEFDDADVIIAHWGPEVEPIVIRCPDDVEVHGAVWRHMKDPKMVPSMTPEEWRRREFPHEFTP